MTIKVAYHDGYGGFGLPLVVAERFCELMGIEVDMYKISKISPSYYIDVDLPRHDKRLVQAIEEFERECADHSVLLRTLKGNKYIIEEYDGWEEVKEPEDIEWIEVSDD